MGEGAGCALACASLLMNPTGEGRAHTSPMIPMTQDVCKSRFCGCFAEGRHLCQPKRAGPLSGQNECTWCRAATEERQRPDPVFERGRKPGM